MRSADLQSLGRRSPSPRVSVPTRLPAVSRHGWVPGLRKIVSGGDLHKRFTTPTILPPRFSTRQTLALPHPLDSPRPRVPRQHDSSSDGCRDPGVRRRPEDPSFADSQDKGHRVDSFWELPSSVGVSDVSEPLAPCRVPPGPVRGTGSVRTPPIPSRVVRQGSLGSTEDPVLCPQHVQPIPFGTPSTRPPPAPILDPTHNAGEVLIRPLLKDLPCPRHSGGCERRTTAGDLTVGGSVKTPWESVSAAVTTYWQRPVCPSTWYRC